MDAEQKELVAALGAKPLAPRVAERVRQRLLPAIDLPSSSTLRQIEAQANVCAAFATKVLRESLLRVDSECKEYKEAAKAGSAEKAQAQAHVETGAVLFRAAEAALEAMHALKSQMTLSSPSDLERHWGRLAYNMQEMTLTEEALRAVARVREGVPMLRPKVTSRLSSRLRGGATSTSTTAAATPRRVARGEGGERGAAQAPLLLPEGTEDTDVLRIVVQVLYIEARCYVDRGRHEDALRVFEDEWPRWVDALARSPQPSSSSPSSQDAAKAAMQYCAAAFTLLSRSAPRDAATAERCLACAFAVLARSSVDAAVFFSEANAVVVRASDEARRRTDPLAVLRSQPAVARAAADLVRRGGCYAELSDWAARTASLARQLLAAGEPRALQPLADVVRCVDEYLRGAGESARGYVAFVKAAESLALLEAIAGAKGGDAALLGALDESLRSAVDSLDAAVAQLGGLAAAQKRASRNASELRDVFPQEYVLLFRIVKSFVDLKKHLNAHFDPFAKDGVALPGETLQLVVRALGSLLGATVFGIGWERRALGDGAAADRGDGKGSPLVKFGLLLHFTVELVQAQVQAQQKLGVVDVKRLVEQAQPVVSIGDSVVLKRLGQVVFSYGASLNDASESAAAVEAFRWSCDLWKRCPKEEQEQLNLIRRFDAVSTVLIKMESYKDAIDSIVVTAVTAYELGLPLSKASVQMLARICTNYFAEEPRLQASILAELRKSRPCERLTEFVRSASEMQLEALQARSAPISHQLALLDELISLCTEALVEKGKLVRLENPQTGLPDPAEASRIFVSAITLLKECKESVYSLDDLAVAYAWNGITIIEAQRFEAPKQTIADGIRSFGLALALLSRQLVRRTAQGPVRYNANTLQVLHSMCDMLELVGDPETELAACHISDQVSKFSELTDLLPLCANVNARLNAARIHCSLGYTARALAEVAAAEEGVRAWQQRAADSDSDEEASENNAATVFRLRLLASAVKLVVLNASSDDDVDCAEAEEMLAKALAAESKTWEDYAVVSELEYALAECYLHKGLWGKALQLAGDSLNHKCVVTSTLFPGVLPEPQRGEDPSPSRSRSARNRLLQASLHSRILFSDKRQGLAESFLQNGWINELRERIHNAEFYYQRGLELGRVLKIPSIAFNFLQELGELHYKMADLKVSADYFEEMKTTYNPGDVVSPLKKKDDVLMHMRLGDLKRRSGELDGAMSHYADAQRLITQFLDLGPPRTPDTLRIIAHRGDETPREARILGLSRKTKSRRAPKPSKSKSSAADADADDSGIDAGAAKRKALVATLPLDSLSGRLQGKMARVAHLRGDLAQAARILKSALTRPCSRIVACVLHLRLAEVYWSRSNVSTASEEEAEHQRDKALEHGNRAYDVAVVVGTPKLLQQTCSLLAFVNGERDCFASAFYLNASLGVNACQQVLSMHADDGAGKAEAAKPDGAHDDLCADLEDVMQHDDKVHASLFDYHANREHFQEAYVDILPATWTVVTMALSEDMNMLQVTRMQPRAEPEYLCLDLEQSAVPELLAELRGIKEENSTTARDLGEKVQWWKNREKLEKKLRKLADECEEVMLGPEKDIVVTPAATADAEGSSPSDKPERCPLVLVLDKHLQQFPWESFLCLRGQPVTRSPSLAFVSNIVAGLREGEGSISTWDPVSQGLDVENAFYLVDPADNLPKTVKNLQPLLDEHAATWRGAVSSAPQADALKAAIEASELFLYCGHGTGEQYLPGNELRSLKHCPAVLLMGCSSGSLLVQGDFEPTGMAINYLIARSPAVVGNLWDVTDGDLDLLTLALFDNWGPERSLAAALALARNACKFPYLVGAAAVCYGVPLLVQNDGSKQSGSG
eukprot:m51a1_g4920 putative separin (1853) ;mRNA; r:223679-233009